MSFVFLEVVFVFQVDFGETHFELDEINPDFVQEAIEAEQGESEDCDEQDDVLHRMLLEFKVAALVGNLTAHDGADKPGEENDSEK